MGSANRSDLAKASDKSHPISSRRRALGLSQAELARRSGISRSLVSAIEGRRVVPSVDAAIRLSKVLGRSVEELFTLAGATEDVSDDESRQDDDLAEGRRVWWSGTRPSGWLAAESTGAGLLPHDAVIKQGKFESRTGKGLFSLVPTIVIAGCDPAVGILASALKERGIRLIALSRGSKAALKELAEGRVHGAGVHMGSGGVDRGAATSTGVDTSSAEAVTDNACFVRSEIGESYVLLRIADWNEGVAFDPAAIGLRSLATKRLAKSNWVMREPGSAARACFENIARDLGLPADLQSSKKIAPDHRTTATLLRWGWGEVGVCVELAAKEQNLGFLTVRREAYDLCIAEAQLDAEGMRELVRVVRSKSFRAQLGDLPGYDTSRSGELRPV
jgi:molybdate-binding protein/transcriptional regulator with XRE-family HTH domain